MGKRCARAPSLVEGRGLELGSQPGHVSFVAGAFVGCPDRSRFLSHCLGSAEQPSRQPVTPGADAYSRQGFERGGNTSRVRDLSLQRQGLAVKGAGTLLVATVARQSRQKVERGGDARLVT